MPVDWAGRPHQCPYSSLLREGLASPPVTRLSRVGSYPTISPLPAKVAPRLGGVISVALSLGSPRVVVNDFPALWSPDFPPAGGHCPPAIFRPPPAGSYTLTLDFAEADTRMFLLRRTFRLDSDANLADEGLTSANLLVLGSMISIDRRCGRAAELSLTSVSVSI